VGRHRAARPGLGPWVGARVASPRCPILRSGNLSVAAGKLIGQFTFPGPGPDAGQRWSLAPACPWYCWCPRSTAWDVGCGAVRTNHPFGTLGHAAATRKSPGSSRTEPMLAPLGADRHPGARSAQPRFFSSRSSIARYSRTKGKPHPRACAVCSGVSPSIRQWRTRSYWPR
jgi:hypothetical protein